MKIQKTLRSKKPVVKKVLSGPKVKVVKRSKEKSQTKTIGFGMHTLRPPKGSHKKKKLLGRGPSSGHGKTSTRGSKGQTSRAGRHFYLGFEGGQSPLIRKFPKRGFTNIFKKEFQIVNLKDLGRIKNITAITPQVLKENGLIRDKDKPVKVLGDGEIKNPLNIKAHAFSKKAQDKIRTSGGTIEIMT